MKTKVSDASTNTNMSFSSSGNVSAEASEESIEIDFINTDISDNWHDSFHPSQTGNETNDEEIQNSECNNILTEKK